MKQKTTMIEKARKLKAAALVAGVLVPGTGIPTILHNLSQIYMACDVYWHPVRAEALVSMFAPNGDVDVVDDNRDTKKEDDGGDLNGGSQEES